MQALPAAILSTTRKPEGSKLVYQDLPPVTCALVPAVGNEEAENPINLCCMKDHSLGQLIGTSVHPGAVLLSTGPASIDGRASTMDRALIVLQQRMSISEKLRQQQTEVWRSRT